ncbi:MAG: histidine--tRNA ligase [Planctomycetota bacterium]|jgi:histidyl-tRNA synthetase|nr:histidine--tRNA ligase [Planctomycetota bacterium]
MTEQRITPRTLKGFRDFLPETMIPRERLMETARSVYRSYGFVPIETPTLEYSEILCGKGGEESDRQMFRFEDHGGRDVGMRFDLTVPLARYVAQHNNELGLPFKRYHIGMVWRGEKPQVGRYREFAQCDFDTIGSTSIASDIETALVIHDLMRAIGFENFNIRVNNRKILNGLLQKFDVAHESVAVLRAIDKLPKIGRDKVREEITGATAINDQQVEQILGLAEISGNHADVIRQLESVCQGNELAEQGLQELAELTEATRAVGVAQEQLQIDVSIARGLDYYTGTIFETFLNDLPGIGSVCSGGRYDNLADLFTKQQLPGIGASLGLDRLLAAMQTLEMIPAMRTTADILVVQFDAGRLSDYFRIAGKLRAAGISTEVYPAAKRLGQQFKYADRKGFQAVIVAGSDELESGHVQLKWLADGSQHELSSDNGCAEVIGWLQEKLAK